MSQAIEAKTEFRLAKDTDCTVLITGPTGVGKSHLAARIHALGKRAAKTFVPVHMSSLHEGTLESELFGHERGAFTGAVQRQVGWLERAQGGTLFLDEVAELSPASQAKLLEFLQTKKFSPMGSRKSISADVRIICATNRDLSVEVREGRFREDLYHRMRVVTLELPPLKKFPENLDRIVHDFLEELGTAHGKRVSRIEPKVAEFLEAYSWPGNFRELRNVLEFALLASEDGTLKEIDLPSWFVTSVKGEIAQIDLLLQSDGATIDRIPSGDGESFRSLAKVLLAEDYDGSMKLFEKALLHHALSSTGGHLTRAAEKLKIPKSTFSRRASELGLKGEKRPKTPGLPRVKLIDLKKLF